MLLRRTYTEVNKIQSGAKFGLSTLLQSKVRWVKTVLACEGLMDTEAQAYRYDTGIDQIELCLFRIEVPTTNQQGSRALTIAAMELEEKAAKLSNEQSQGTVLKYGQQVQLRHLHSHGLLSLSLLRAGIEPGTFKITVTQKEKSVATWVTLMPENKLQKIGEQIKYADRVNIAFQEGGLQYFLHLHMAKGALEVNGSHYSSAWLFSMYEDFDADQETVRCSMPVKIRLAKSSLHISEKHDIAGSHICLMADPNDYRGLWSIEREQPFEGGNLHFGDFFYLKNAQSGLYLGPDLTLQKDRPESHYALHLPKPESFLYSSRVGFNFPLIFSYSNFDQLAAKSSVRKEEILSQIVPCDFATEDEDVRLETEMAIDRSGVGTDVLFEFVAVEATERGFLMQVAKLVPKMTAFNAMLLKRVRVEEGKEAEDEALIERGTRLQTLTFQLKSMIVSSANPDLLEMRQNAIVGFDLHKVLISIAFTIAKFRLKTLSKALATMVKSLFTGIWELLIEVSADNQFACMGIEKQKDEICKLVHLEQKLIGSLLTEVYRLTDPDMPDYIHDFRKWCNRVKTLKESNIEKQTVFIRLIRCLCEVGEDVKLEYQRAILSCLFGPSGFSILHLISQNDHFYVRFCPRDSLSPEFSQLHPNLTSDETLLKETGFSYVDLSQINRFPAYIDYIYAALSLISTLCKGVLENGRIAARTVVGLESDLVLGMMEDLKLHIKIREACLMLADSLMLTAPPNVATLEKKEKDQCFIADELQDAAHHHPEFTDPIDSERLQTREVRSCLKLTLALWTQMETPAQLQHFSLHAETGVPPTSSRYTLLEELDYLRTSLHMSYSLMDHEHCSQLYIACLTRALVYLLIGMTDDQPARFAKKHWAVASLKTAIHQSGTSLDLRLRISDIFKLLVELLKAVGAHVTQAKCVQLLRLCIWGDLEQDTKRIRAVMEAVNDPLRDVSMIKRMMSRATYYNKRHPRETAGMEMVDEASFSTRSVLLHAPEIKDYLFRSVLSSKSIAPELKETVIKLIKQLFNDRVRICKFLRNVDLIADEEIIRNYTVLREVKAKARVPQLTLDCRLELKAGMEPRAIISLCETLLYVTNCINSRKKMSNIRLLKTQNILRHLSFHRQFMALWPICLHSPSESSAFYPHWKRLRTLLVSFLYYFCKGNPRNQQELKRLFSPSYFFSSVPQYPELIREISQFEVLDTDIASRLISFVLSNVDEDFNTFSFVKTVMFRSVEKPREDIQNIASRFISEKLFQSLSPLRPNLVASLIQLLALACFDNTHGVIQSRNVLSLSELLNLSTTESPLLHHSIISFLHIVYLRNNLEITPTSHTEVVLSILQNAIKVATPVLEGNIDIVDAGEKGRFEQVLPKENPTLVDLVCALDPLNPIRSVLRLVSSGSEDEMKGGLVSYIPLILESLTTNQTLAFPLATEFISKLNSFLQRIQVLEESQPSLDFSLLINQVNKCKKNLDDFCRKINHGFDRETALNTITQMFVSTMKRKQVVLSTCKEVMLENKLKLFRTFYEEHFATEDTDAFVIDLVENFNYLAFKGAFPEGKVPKEVVNLMVKLLDRVKGLFASTRNRRLYFKFLKTLIPDIDNVTDLRKKAIFTEVILQTGVVEEAVDALIKNEAIFASNSTLEFLNKLLDEQTKEFQDKLQALLEYREKAYYLFSRFKSEIASMKQRVFDRVTNSSVKNKGLLQCILLSEQSVLTEMEEKEEPASDKEKYILNMLIFLQLCCDNCNVDFQNYIRSQSKQAGLADVDLVSEVATFVIDLSSVSDFVLIHKPVGKMFSKAFAALLDFVTGPCIGNQTLLGTSVPMYLAITKLLKSTQTDLDPPGSKIHTKIILFLLTLLEGEPDVSVYETMLKFMDLGLMRTGLETIFYDYVQGKEETFSLETAEKSVMDKVKIMILQAIFLVKLQAKADTHPELKKFTATSLDESCPYNFYIRYIGYVEVEKVGVIQAHYFPVPFKCKYLTNASRVSLLIDVNRNSHQKKIEDFMSRVQVYMREMAHQQTLSRFKRLKALISKWQLFAQVSFAFVFVINLQLLFTFSGSLKESMTLHPINVIIITGMGIMQLVLYMTSFVFNLLEYFPNKLNVTVPPRQAEIEKYSKLPYNESQYLNLLYQDMASPEKNEKESFENSIRVIFNNLDFYYSYVYFLVSVIAIYYPLLYPVLMLDLVQQNQELVNVLKSITVNARQLIITLCLGMIIIFLFSVYSFVFFQSDYISENGLSCSDLLHCFASTLHMGVRASGGIGDSLQSPDHAGTQYWSRMIFDLLFYLILIIILLNIIFGIIIDTFAQLRNQRMSILQDINNTCYICGLERSEIEHKAKGWMHHFMAEHVPLTYLAFLVYLTEMPMQDCAGVEKYVKEKFQRNDFSFMPTSSLHIQLVDSHTQESANS